VSLKVIKPLQKQPAKARKMQNIHKASSKQNE